MKKLLLVGLVGLSALLGGCASYVPPVESAVTEFRPGVYMVDSRAPAVKVTQGEAIQMNLFEVSKYMVEENQGQCILYSTQKVDRVGNDFAVLGVAKVEDCSNENAIYASSIVKSYGKWYERKKAEFESE
ncbi:MAG: hypothetical protein ACRCUJ_04190, partial [Phocaeicola sp.]